MRTCPLCVVVFLLQAEPIDLFLGCNVRDMRDVQSRLRDVPSRLREAYGR